MNTLRLGTSDQAIEQAAALLRQGELVAFPTETVYGLGAHALDPLAVDKIFAAKGRPSDNPLIVHIAHRDQLAGLAESLPPVAEQLMEVFWPGPLTLILPRRAGVPDRVTAGLSTVAVRMPDHPVALALLEQTGVPIAAPSANRSGRPSPTSAEHVLEDLEGRVAAVVDGGDTGVGVESTVLDVTVDPPMILRPGGITKEMLEQVTGKVQVDPSLSENRHPDPGSAPRSPGMKYTHYAPQGEMWIVVGDVDKQSATIQSLVDKSRREGIKTGVLTTEERKGAYRADAVLSCGERGSLETVAAGLYGVLREFDQLGIERIYSESFPEAGIGMAVMNRLRKAAGYRVIRAEN
ncbi:L-threonylcarbamoyladenylate synthase [Effusibacillus lacus]|uniref:Threonylcarbamoyl-AMP synthase n=1 Tax=Effusibacillus lacus TaxID=1348429 RepID=A0A292YL05_9BACL|nr:L-threonylcarbamoyladenylate synthase [Effusibacillus lacus]TCS71842.1 translation factor SUA5 [Effusibacillus lacus]GAX89591.1 threonylcarbamoyl-AMP synthase [Effusibacillus lacus]